MANYRITQMEIGYDQAFPIGVAFDMWNRAGDTGYSPFSITLVETEGTKLLFDCGFDPESDFAKAKIAMENDQNCRNTADVLRANGVDPEEIDILVISHCHWDHLSGLKYFPNARIYVQAEEVSRWTKAMADETFPLTHKMVVDMECLSLLNQWIEDGKVTLLRGDMDELLPGLNVRRAAGHSFAQNILLIDSDGQHYAVVGDVAMRPESFVGCEMFPCYLPNLKFSVGTIQDILASYDMIVDWIGGDVDHILMSHDGTLPEKRETVTNALGLHAFRII